MFWILATAADFLRTIGADDQHGRLANLATQVEKQISGCLIDPVQVIQDEQQGALQGQPVDNPGILAKELALLGAAGCR